MDTWRTVRVFISSTFRDMHSERDWLVKRVFPALREWLEPHRVHLVDIDLRWGVTEQQAEHGGALDVCLQQIDACRPFFLGLLGERYGWTPERLDPSTVRKIGDEHPVTRKSITELEILYGVLAKPEMRGHAFFGFRDPSFIADVPLARRADVEAESEEAAQKMAALKERIRNSGLPRFEGYPCRFAGLRVNRRLVLGDQASDEERRVLWRAVGEEGLLTGEKTEALSPELRELVDRSSHVALGGLEEFGDRISKWLRGVIRVELELFGDRATATNPLTEERGFHERFQESRTRVYVGREDLQRRLFAFADGSDEVPCLVSGPSGSGKSATLAKFVADYAAQRPQTLVLSHFVGASPASTNLRQTLRRFCLEFKNVIGFADGVPADTNSLIATFRDFVGKVPSDRRVLLVIDALNQLDEADDAQQLHWLPWKTPSHVKIVASCIDDPGREEPASQAFANRERVAIRLEPLRDEEREAIVREVPSLSAKSLDPRQVELFLRNPATENPLYLLVALEELRGFGSYEQLNRRIEDFPREGDAVTELFVQVIERMEQEFDPEIVRSLLTLLASARRGLSDRELLDVLEGSDLAIGDSRSDLFPVLHQLRPYLQHRGQLRDFFHRNLYKAVHAKYLGDDEDKSTAHSRLAKYFDEQDYFLESLEEQRARAKRLPPTPRPVNIRKVDELPWQMLQVARLLAKDDPTSPRWDGIVDLFADLQFLEAKAEADPKGSGAIYDAVQDLGDLLAAIPAEHPRRRLLALLDEGVRRDLQFLERHPTAVFQCLWNSCWWYDAPAAADHYVPPAQGWPSGVAPWDRPALAPLLERWRSEKERSQPDFRWARSLRPPRDSLGSARRLEFRGHSGGVSCLALSPDGRILASGCGSGGFGVEPDCRLWDAQRGQLRGSLATTNSGVAAAAFSPDGQFLATAGAYSHANVQVWDVATGRQVAAFFGTGVALVDVAFSPDGRLLFAADYRTALVWDWANGEALESFHSSAREAVALGWGPSGLRIASASPDGRMMWVCDARTGDLIAAPIARPQAFDARRLTTFASDAESLFLAEDDELVWRSVRSGDSIETRRAPLAHVSACTIADNRRRFAVTDGMQVVLQEWSTGKTCLRFDCYGAQCLRFSQLGRRLAVGCYDGSVHVWDVLTGERLLHFEGHDAPITALAFGPFKNQLAVGTEQGKLVVWDVDAQVRLPSEGYHYRPVTDLRFSPDGERCYSASADWEVREWETTAWQELSQIRAHQRSPYRLVPTLDGLLAVTGPDQGPQADDPIRLCDAATGADLVRFRDGGSPCTTVAVSADRRLLASGFADGSIRVDKFSDGQPIMEASAALDAPVLCLAFSVDGGRLASATRDQIVRVWSVATGHEIERFGGDFGPVPSLIFSSDGRHLFGGCGDGAIRSWELGRQDASPKLKDDVGPVARLALSPAGQAVSVEAVLRDDELFPDVFSPTLMALQPTANLPFPPETARVWDLETGRVHASIPTSQEEITAVACSPDGSQFATGSGDGTVYVWDAASYACLARLQAAAENAPSSEDDLNAFSDASSALPGGKVRSLNFSSDGRLLIAATSEAFIQVWDCQRGSSRACFWAGPGRIAVCIAPDGESLLTSRVLPQQLFQAASTVITHWSLEGEVLAELDAPFLPPAAAAIASPDGRRAFAVGSQVDGGSVLIAWEIGGAYQCWYGDFEGDPRMARALGRTRLAIETVGGLLGGAKSGISDLRTFSLDVPVEPSVVGEDTSPATKLAFSPDGKWLASFSDDGGGTVLIRDLERGSRTRLVGSSGNVKTLQWLPGRERLLTSTEDGRVRIWDPIGGTETACFALATGRLSSLAVSPDGTRFALADESHLIRVYESASGVGAGSFLIADDAVESVAFSADGSRVAGVGPSAGWIWDARTGTALVRFALDSGYGYVLGEKMIAFAPEDDWVSVATIGASVPAVHHFDARSGELLSSFDLMSTQGCAIAWSADGRWLVAGSDDRVRIFDTRESAYGRRVGADLASSDVRVTSVAVSANGGRVAAAREDGSLEVWRPWLPTAERTRLRGRREGMVLESLGQSAAWAAHPDAPDLATVSADGRTLAGASGAHLSLLRLEGELPAEEEPVGGWPLPTATPTRIYLHDRGEWDSELTVSCPGCGSRFAPPQEALSGSRRADAPDAAGRRRAASQGTAARLSCLSCGRDIRLSGVLVDNRGVRYEPAPPSANGVSAAASNESDAFEIDFDFD